MWTLYKSFIKSWFLSALAYGAVVLLSIVLTSAPSFASVAVNPGDSGTNFAHTASGTSLNLTSYTIGSGATIAIAFLSATVNVGSPACTWNGTSMTEVGSGIFNSVRNEIFYLGSPASGNQTLACSWTTTAEVTIALISFTGSATSPVGADTVTNSASSGNPTTGAITSTTDGVTIGLAGGGTGTCSLTTSNQTQIYLDNGTTALCSGSTYALGGTSNTHNWTLTGSALWSAIGIHIDSGSGGSSQSFTQQPTTTINGSAFSPTVTVTVSPAAADSITLSLSASCGTVSLTGTLTVTANAGTGVATFTGVGVTGLGTSCTLNAHDNTNAMVTDATSSAFSVINGTNDVYLANADTGGVTGLDCADAKSFTYFDTSGNWSATPSGILIGPGTTVHLCGTINLATSGFPNDALVFQGSGTSGHPVTLKWESGAILQSTAFISAGAIENNTNSWIVIDGGTNGIMQNTSNGSVGNNGCVVGACSNVNVDTQFMQFTGGSNITVKNLSMKFGYVRTANDSAINMGVIPDTEAIGVANVSNFTLTNSEIDNQATGVAINGDSAVVSFLTVRSTNHPITIGPVANTTITCATIHDNDLSGGSEWDDDFFNQYHHDYLFFQSGGYGTCQNGVVYNNFMHGIQSSASSISSHISAAIGFFDGGNCGPTNPGTRSTFEGMLFFNNIIEYDATANNVPGDPYDTGFGGLNGWFINNTIYAPGGVAPKMWAPSPHSTDPTCTGVPTINSFLVKNNLFVSGGFGSGVAGGGAQMNQPSGWQVIPWPDLTQIDYNIYAGVNATVSGLFSLQDTTNATFTGWQTAGADGGGFDSHGSTPTVAAVNMNTSTFVPGTGGSANATGVNLTALCSTAAALCNDKNGNARPMSAAWDVGALNASTTNSQSFTQQPTNTVAGNTFASTITVTLSSGNADSITLSVVTGLCTLTGTTTVTASGGVATFSGLGVGTTRGSACVLKSHDNSDGTVADITSSTFNVTGTQAFSSQPTTTVSGNTISPTITVTTTPSSSDSITISVTTGTCTLTGTTTVTASSGVATFTGIVANAVGAGCVLTAHDNTTSLVPDQTSNAFSITASPHILTFTTQPGSLVTGNNFSPTVVVTVNASVTDSITITINGCGAPLSGTTTQSAVAGVTTFTGMGVTGTGSGCVLTATDNTDGTVSPVNSNAFLVAASTSHKTGRLRGIR